jgi:tetratricopeptide (TPR) repeat protein
MNWYEKAEDASRRAESILRITLGERHCSYRDSVNLLYTVLAECRKYPEAQKQIRHSLKLVTETEGTSSPAYAAGLHNLVQLLPDMGEGGLLSVLAEFVATDELRPTIHDTVDRFFALTEKGYPAVQLALLEKVAEIERANGLESTATYASTLLSLGRAHRLTGDFKAAEASIRQSLDVQRKCATHPRPELALHLNALADICVVAGRPLEALDLMREANSVDTFVLSQVFVTGSEEERAKHSTALRRNFHAFLSLVLDFFRDSGDALNSAFDLTLHRKGMGGEALSAQREAMLNGKHNNASDGMEWRRLRMEIARRTLAGPSEDSAGSPQETIPELTARKEAIERKLARTMPETGLSRLLQTADRAAVQSALPADSALVEFAEFAKFDFSLNDSSSVQYAAFVLLKADAAVHVVDLGAREPVDQLVVRFRSAVAGEELGRHLGSAPAHVQPAGNQGLQSGLELRRLVFDPLLPALRDVSRVFIAADGDLTRLPLETLPSDSGGYLIDRYQFSYLNDDAVNIEENPFGCAYPGAD